MLTSQQFFLHYLYFVFTDGCSKVFERMFGATAGLNISFGVFFKINSGSLISNDPNPDVTCILCQET